MIPKEFLSKLEDQKIVEAIGRAEAKTSGEIRVFISDGEVGDTVEMAKNQFEKMGMTNTKERNGVLIFVAPRARKFAVLGDQGVHTKCGDDFWKRIAGAMEEKFRGGQFSEGIVEAVGAAGEVLGEHFPRAIDDVNELPDRVERE
jgi:uncharacterized membrane protein